MTKYEYISALEKNLAPMPYAEKIKMLDFYREMIEDRIESGMTEEEVVNELGEIRTLADRLLEEYRAANSEKESVTPPAPSAPQPSSNGVAKVLLIIALVLGSPLIIAVAATVASVVFAVAIAVFSIVVAFIAAAIGTGVAGIAAFATAFLLLGGNFFAFLLQLGISFLLVAICMLLIAGGVGCIRLLMLFIRAISDAVRNRRHSKEAH